MIDLNTIKDDKPRKGPARMSKSEKSPTQERWRKYYSQLRQLRSGWRSEVEGVCVITGLPTRRINDRLGRSVHDRLRVAREVEQILRDVEESLDP